MHKYNILYIEDTVGLGGSLVSLCLFLQNHNKKKYNPYAVLYHKSQELYLNGICKGVKTIVARPSESFKSSTTGKVLLKLASLLGNKGRQVGSLLIFCADFLFTILPYSLKIYFSVRRNNIHLVHLNTGVCIPGILIAKILRVPCIATQRGPEWMSPIIRFFSKHVIFFMANSGATKEGLLQMGVDPSKISVVYPPVNLKTFNPNIDSRERKKEFNMGSDKLSFGILGNLYEGKGQKIVIQAAVEVLKVFPICNVFIIGDDPDGSGKYKNELRCYANTLGIGPNVIFTGFRKDMPELIQLLDVVVHASLFPEPFGKVIIEGMAMRKPVVATRSSGTTEIIDDGIDGFLVPPNDSKVLAQKLICLLGDNGLRRKIGDAAFHKVKAYFSIEKHMIEVERIYEKVLGG